MESITHARALGQWARGGAAAAVVTESVRVATSSSGGGRVCVCVATSESGTSAGTCGRQTGRRRTGECAARRARVVCVYSFTPPWPPAATLTSTAVSVGGGNSVMWVGRRRLVSLVCVRVRARVPCAVVTSRRRSDRNVPPPAGAPDNQTRHRRWRANGRRSLLSRAHPADPSTAV